MRAKRKASFFRVILAGLIFILAVVLFTGSFLFFSAWTQWKSAEQEYLDRFQGIIDHISQAAEKKHFYEFQLNETGQMVKARSTQILDRHGELIGEFLPGGNLIVFEDELPPVFVQALLAMEDSRFYEHKGVDPRGILRALVYNLKSGRITAGGSTLTQQIAKVLYTSRRRTLSRKVFDAVAALHLEKDFTKQEILLVYVNTVYFGHGANGVGSAARFYFNKQVRNLTHTESALLVGLLGRPNVFSPFRNPHLARKKQKLVLLRMAKLGLLEESSIEAAQDRFWSFYSSYLDQPRVSLWRMRLNRAPYFIEHIRKKLLTFFTEDELRSTPLIIHTTLDLTLQERSAREVRSYLSRRSEFTNGLELAVTALDPADGSVLVMCGGSGFEYENQLNRTVAIHRQIGSQIKPFIYSAAFEEGHLNGQTVRTDKPLVFHEKTGVWNPENFDRTYLGPLTLEDGLRFSRNTISVQLLRETGLSRTIRKLEPFWAGDMNGRMPQNLTLALGTLECSPLEVAQAYCVLANGGHAVIPRTLNQITDTRGNVLYDGIMENRLGLSNLKRKDSFQVLSPETASEISSILVKVLQKGGTAYRATQRSGFSFPMAGKTGTTDGYKDAWFTGFSSRIVLTVWTGYDDHSLSTHNTGGSLAAPLALNILKYFPDRFR